MSRRQIDRIERALHKLIDRVEFDCVTKSPGRRNLDQILELHDNGTMPKPQGMAAVTLSILRGIKELRDELDGRDPSKTPSDNLPRRPGGGSGGCRRTDCRH